MAGISSFKKIKTLRQQIIAIFCFTDQAAMALNPLTVANDGTLAESNVVKLEELEENPVIKDIAMRRSSCSGD